jgi:hypothetical protein
LRFDIVFCLQELVFNQSEMLARFAHVVSSCVYWPARACGAVPSNFSFALTLPRGTRLNLLNTSLLLPNGVSAAPCLMLIVLAALSAAYWSVS